MRYLRAITLAAASVGVLLAVSGCAQEEGPKDFVATASVTTPASTKSPSGPHPSTYNSDRDAWRARISGTNFNPGDFQGRYAEVLKTTSAADQQRLVELGFPSSADLKRLSALSMAELQARVSAGDKAALWYLTDTLAAGVLELQATRSPDGYAGGISDADMISATTDVLNLGGQTLREVEGPFGAYVYGQSLASVTYPPNDEAIAAAYQIAGERGDWRADELYTAYVEAHPGLNMERVQTMQRTMRQILNLR